MERVPADPTAALAEIEQLIDANRVECLWFLRSDYYPSTDRERLRVLEYIERYGDRDAYRRANALKRWLSRRSSAGSAGS